VNEAGREDDSQPAFVFSGLATAATRRENAGDRDVTEGRLLAMNRS